MPFQYSLKSDIGRRRQNNQDRGIGCPEIGLFVVADGMGGHQGGEIASQMVIDIVPDSIRKSKKLKRFDPRKALLKALKEANDSIHDRAQEDSKLNGMGTTSTVILFHNNVLYIAQVGDSRCYFIRQNYIWQLTRDHSLVQEKLKAGMITREQVKKDQLRNVITRSVGFEPNVKIDLYEMTIQPNDLFLLCSDGLSGPLEDLDMIEIVQSETKSSDPLESATTKLVAKANELGGDDNITVLVAQYTT